MSLFRIKSFGFAALLVFAVYAVVLPTVSYAANTDDTSFPFRFDYVGATYASGGRAKSNTTPVYVNVTSMTMDKLHMYVDGGYSKDGAWKNVTRNGVAMVYTEGKYSLHNNVREKGYTYARISGWAAASDEVGRMNGWWSPDSMYTYTSLN